MLQQQKQQQARTRIDVKVPANTINAITARKYEVHQLNHQITSLMTSPPPSNTARPLNLKTVWKFCVNGFRKKSKFLVAKKHFFLSCVQHLL